MARSWVRSEDQDYTFKGSFYESLRLIALFLRSSGSRLVAAVGNAAMVELKDADVWAKRSGWPHGPRILTRVFSNFLTDLWSFEAYLTLLFGGELQPSGIGDAVGSITSRICHSTTSDSHSQPP